MTPAERSVIEHHRIARQHWSTAEVESRDTLAYWVDTICKSFLEIDIDSPQRHHFHGRLDQLELGPASLYVVEADPQTVRRTRERIAHTRYDRYFLLHLRGGQLGLRPSNRDVDEPPESCATKRSTSASAGWAIGSCRARYRNSHRKL